MGQKINANFTRLNLSTNYLSKWYNAKATYAYVAYEDNIIRYYITKFFGKLLSLSNIYINRISNNPKNQNENCQIKVHAKFPSLLKNKKLLELIKKTLKKNHFLKKSDIFLKKKFKKKLNKNYLLKKKISKLYSLEKNLKKKNKLHSVLDFIYLVRNKTKKIFFFRKNFKKNFIKNLFIILIKKYTTICVKFFCIKFNKKYNISFNFIKNKFLDAKLIANSIAKAIKERKNTIYVLKSTIRSIQKFKIMGAFLELSGRLHGVERAKSLAIHFGSVPVQTFSKNVQFAKRKVKTNNGIIGIKVKICLENNVT